ERGVGLRRAALPSPVPRQAAPRSGALRDFPRGADAARSGRRGGVREDSGRSVRADQPSVRPAASGGARGGTTGRGRRMNSKPKILVVDDAGRVVILCVHVLRGFG